MYIVASSTGHHVVCATLEEAKEKYEEFCREFQFVALFTEDGTFIAENY